MARIENTVFISYRRTDVYTALAVYENLKNQGYDVFFDYRSISSGDFDQIITSNIRARAHFILILTPTALDRVNEPGDWLKREIETAIDEKRNIVPLFFRGFRFGASSKSGMSKWFRVGKPEVLMGKLKDLSRYNGLNVHEDYFEEAMIRLRTEYLNKPLDTVLHPVSTDVRKVVREEQEAADQAIKYIEEKKELPKEEPVPTPSVSPQSELDALKSQAIQYELKGDLFNALQTYYKIKHLDPLFPSVDVKIKNLEIELQPKPMESAASIARNAVKTQTRSMAFSWRLTAGLIVGVFLLAIGVWSGASLLKNPPAPDIGSTMISEKEGMTLVYIPAGEFVMGNDDGDEDEQPVHTVYLVAFWIDQTEVTLRMYKFCVDAGACQEPTNTGSSMRVNYYGNIEYDDYPVVYVNWNMAETYCEWAGRRLPTEAEWEKSARGEFAFEYPWGVTVPSRDLLNYNNFFGDTTRVGNFPNGASPYKTYDMAGNVWEWVADRYGSRYYDNSPKSNPTGPDVGDRRVVRGGSWVDADYYEFVVRSSNRENYHADFSSNDIGFRCAMDASP